MNRQVILLLVLAVVVAFVAGFASAVFVLPRVASGLRSFGQPTAYYGPAMMRGGMMGPGMMAGYGNYGTPFAPGKLPNTNTSTPSAPKESDPAPAAPTSTPAPSSAGQSRGRGMMGGSGREPGGLVAVSPDGKTIAADPANNLPENTASQKVGGMNVTLALSPYPPASFQRGDFEIALTDDKGQAITDAKVSLDLTMPGMWMPPSKPDAAHVGSGKYRASAFWTMRGLWRIQVIITRGGANQSAYFDVWL